MFGLKHDLHCDERFAAARGGRGRHGGFGWGGGRHGMGGGDMLRAGRMLATGDLKLIALALIAEQPRHGYEIIKVLEEKSAGWYSPSPGIVYPTLTYLEEAGYVTAQSEGAKKLYSITDEGRAHLDVNRDFVEAVLERIALFGEKVSRMRERFGDDDRRGRRLPAMVRAALDNLGEVAAKRLADEPDVEDRLVEMLARVTAEIRRG